MQFRPTTTRETNPGQRHRCTHQFQKVAARPFVAVQLRRAWRKFAFQPLPKFCGIVQLTQTAPVMLPVCRFGRMLEDAFHRWHPWQFVGGVIFQRSFNVSPISACVSFFFLEKSPCTLLGCPYFATNSAGFTSSGFQSRLKTCSSGRRKFSGCRWHSRHHAMLCGFPKYTVDM